MRILVTGASGFVGSTFARQALHAGHSIGGLVRPGTRIPRDLLARRSMTWFRGTLEDPPWKEIDAFQPNVCLHCAWIATPGVYLQSPENETCFESSLRFLRRARRAGVRHVVGVGTCIEYRSGSEPLSEIKTAIEPKSTYARWKNQLRLALTEEAAKEDFLFTWGRIFYLYGAGEDEGKLCSLMTNRLTRDETFRLQNPLSTRDYIYIDDLAAAVLLTVEKQFGGEINWGTGVGVKLRELAKTLAAILGKEHLIEENEAPPDDSSDGIVADARRLRSLGWRPKVSLAAGLERTAECWLRRHRSPARSEHKMEAVEAKR